MTLLLQNTGAGGTNGVNVTAANSGGGSGNAFNTVTVTVGTLIYDNTHVFHGLAEAYKIGYGAGGSGAVFMSWGVGSVGSVTQLYGRQDWYFAATPTGTNAVLGRFVDSSGTQVLRWVYQTNGTIRLLDSANAQVDISTQTVTNGQPCRIEVHATSDPSNATFELRYYAHVDDTTPTFTMGPYTGRAGGNGTINAMQTGSGVTTTQPTLTAWVSDIAASDTTWLGPVQQASSGDGAFITLTAGDTSYAASDTAAASVSLLATANGILSPFVTTTPAWMDGALGTASSGSTTVTIPSTAQAGDIAVIITTESGNTGTVSVSPSGWSNVDSEANPNTSMLRSVALYKVLGASDPGTNVTLSSSGSGLMTAVIGVWRPAPAGAFDNTPAWASSSVGTSTSAAFASSGAVPTDPNDLAIAVVSAATTDTTAQGSSGSPTGYTKREVGSAFDGAHRVLAGIWGKNPVGSTSQETPGSFSLGGPTYWFNSMVLLVHTASSAADTGGASISLTASGSGSFRLPDTAAASISLLASDSADALKAPETATASISLLATDSTNTLSLPPDTATAVVSLLAAGTGSLRLADAATGAISLLASGTGALRFADTSTATVTLTAAATGSLRMTATASAVVALLATGNGSFAAFGTGTASVSLLASATASLRMPDTATAVLTLTAADSVDALRFADTASAILILLATGRITTATDSGAATISVLATATVSLRLPDSATATVTLLAAALDGLTLPSSGGNAVISVIATATAGPLVMPETASAALSLFAIATANLRVLDTGDATISLLALTTGALRISAPPETASVTIVATATGRLDFPSSAHAHIQVTASSFGDSLGALTGGLGEIELTASDSIQNLMLVPTTLTAHLSLLASGGGVLRLTDTGHASVTLAASATSLGIKFTRTAGAHISLVAHSTAVLLITGPTSADAGISLVAMGTSALRLTDTEAAQLFLLATAVGRLALPPTSAHATISLTAASTPLLALTDTAHAVLSLLAADISGFAFTESAAARLKLIATGDGGRPVVVGIAEAVIELVATAIGRLLYRDVHWLVGLMSDAYRYAVGDLTDSKTYTVGLINEPTVTGELVPETEVSIGVMGDMTNLDVGKMSES